MEYDVIVVGGGNAGFTAAHAAAVRGRSVVLLEKGAEDMAGGNSFFSAGATRIAHNGLDDIRDIVDFDERHAHTVVPSYSEEDYIADLAKVTEGKNDPELSAVLAAESQATVRWLKDLGMKYRLMYERQSYKRPDGTYLFSGGVHLGNVGGGKGLIADHTRVARELGADIRYGQDVIDLIVEDGRVVGVRVQSADRIRFEIRAQSVILAAGGFEANSEMRRKYLGRGWENAKVRGTAYNTGRMLEAALNIGAVPGGDWSTCHSVQWDAFTPDNESNRELTNRLTRQGYPLGLIVNLEGTRFLDEGEDFRTYTDVKYGKEVLKQTNSVAYQVFDAPLQSMLRAEQYDMPGISVQVEETIDALAKKIDVDPRTLEQTVRNFNVSIERAVAFDPTIKDGRAANVHPPKSNWAVPLETAPFFAYAVTCGITFTFGGLKSDAHGRVIDAEGENIPGLYVCGEMLGGLFSGNYPGGSGLPAGFVFGRRAGSLA